MLADRRNRRNEMRSMLLTTGGLMITLISLKSRDYCVAIVEKERKELVRKEFADSPFVLLRYYADLIDEINLRDVIGNRARYLLVYRAPTYAARPRPMRRNQSLASSFSRVHITAVYIDS